MTDVNLIKDKLMPWGSTLLIGGLIMYVGSAIFWLLESSPSTSYPYMEHRDAFNAMEALPDIGKILAVIGAILIVLDIVFTIYSSLDNENKP